MPPEPTMRRFSLAALLLTTACGGGSDPSSPPPPPPPPPAPVPAALTLTTGDNQEATPGSPVAANPVFRVTTAAGAPVPGTQVTFAIEAGGGTLEHTSASTASDGTVSPGTWTLGPTETENRLRATTGSLPPAVAKATGKFPPGTLANATIGPAGGSLVYSKPGDPLDGFRLTIPVGAFPQAGHWNVTLAAPATGAVPPGFRRGPRLSITTDQGTAAAPIQLKIPVHLGTDSVAAVFLENPATGAAELLTPVTRNAGSVTVAAWQLAGGVAVRGASGSGFAAPAAPASSPAIVQVQVTRARTAGTVSSAFQPGRDDWEFPDYGSYITPGGHSGGQAMSALGWFFDFRLSQGALNRKFRTFGPLSPAAWGGNPLGYRVAALATNDGQWTAITQRIQSLGPQVDGTVTFDEMLTETLFAAFLYYGNPQLVVAQAPGQPPVGLVAYEVAYTVVAGTMVPVVRVADPNNPGAAIDLSLVNRHFLPRSIAPVAGGPAVSYSDFRLAGGRANLDMTRLAGYFADVAFGQVGVPNFPAYTLEYFDEDFAAWQPLPDPLVVSWSQIQVRARCPGCAIRLSAQGAADLVGVDAYDQDGILLAGDRTTGSVSFRVPAGKPKVGLHVFAAPVQGAGGPTWRHLDFKAVTIQSSTWFITPDPAAPAKGAPFTLTANNQVPATTPAQATYIWDFGDGTGATVQDNPIVQHTWNANGNFTASVIVKNRVTDKKVGKATAAVVVGGALPIWRLTLFHLDNSTFAKNPTDLATLDIFSKDDGIFRTLQSVPGKGLIIQQAQSTTIGNVTYGPGVYLQFDLVGNATTLDPTLQYRVLARPAQTPSPWVDFNDAYNGGVASPFNGGAINGKAANFYLPGADAHTITEWEINATVSGTQMTGTMRRIEYLWEPDCKVVGGVLTCPPFGTPRVFFGTIQHDWSFKAVRLH